MYWHVVFVCLGLLWLVLFELFIFGWFGLGWFILVLVDLVGFGLG